MEGVTKECLVFLLFLFNILLMKSIGANVTYDSRALVIDGKRSVLISGSIHYPRSTPEMWPNLIQKSKDGGLDVIETYVFWNVHEPVKNQYDFDGRLDLVKFVKLIAEAGMYVHLRIGPYVCAEWNYGGFPLWLHFIPGIKFRTDNEPFKAEMQRFTAKIVDMMKEEKLYASNGGPIILSQIENEYGNIQASYGSAAKSYVNWAAKMATSLNTGVPWVMCQQADAPDPIINTCNGFYCDQFTPNSKNKPKMWTENWSGWYLSFGGRVPYRPVEDLAFSVARFYQHGGTFQNYYMYHGGTNFDRTSGGPFIATSYDYDAPLDEYGLIRQPKWGHLKDLNKAIKLCQEALVASDPAASSLGPNLEATVYKKGSRMCAAFLANVGTSDATVKFNGDSYHLPAWSVSILPDCKNVAFNTAKLNSMTIIPTFKYWSLQGDAILYEVANSGSTVNEPASISEHIATKKLALLENVSTEGDKPLKKYADPLEAIDSDWSWINEPVGISKDDAFTKVGFLEQINTTADSSDYLWYSLSTEIKGDEPFLEDGSQTVLHVESLGHALHAFINGKLTGSRTGNSLNAKVSVQIPITMLHGKNRIDLLSITVGLQNYGAFFDTNGAGITGPVSLKGSKNDISFDLSSQQWTYQVGLKGDNLGLPSGRSPEWVSQGPLPKKQPLTWYKANFDTPEGNDPVALDFSGMGKGEAWVNGKSIGRYWPTNIAPSSGCTSYCNYRGSYNSDKCLKNCGKPSQERYHVPRSWLQRSGNTLVLFEEIGGNPELISLATKRMEILCSHISESHPSPVDAWNPNSKAEKKSGPTLHLECPYPNQTISSINFASFGTPEGTCGSYSHGKCSSDGALSLVQKACVGSKLCNIEVSVNTFGDPCKKVTKSLAVEATCR